MKYFVHEHADVQTELIGHDTKIWQFVVILGGARIGAECNVCSHCFIEADVVVGDRVTIKNGVQLWNGLRVGNDVFIGPNASFSNDPFPRSKKTPSAFLETFIGDGASIGSGAVILPGISIGKKAMVAAGAVVTRSVPPNAIVMGNPARIVGYADTLKSHLDSPSEAGTRAASRQKTNVPGVSLIQMPRIADVRGSLTVGEVQESVPFLIERYFLVFDVPSKEIRGEHAHKTCHQLLVCAHGSCAVVAEDGVHREEFILDRPNAGLHIPPMVWTVQYKFSPDAALLVLASERYDPSDYIREYEEFLRTKARNK